MAVLSMKKVNICALKKDRKAILETLQRLGLVEVSDMDENLADFKKIDTFNMRSVFDKNKIIAQNALEILEKYIPEEKVFLSNICGQNDISKENYYIFANETEEIMRVANEIVRLSKLIDDEKAEIIRLNTQVDALADWKNLDVPMNFEGTKKTRVFIGTLPLDIGESGLKTLLAEALPNEEMYTLQVLSRSAEQTCIFVLCHVSVTDKIWPALRENGFALPTFVSDEVPSLKIEEILRKIKDIETQIFNAEKEIKSYKGQRNAIKFMVDYHAMRSQKYEVISKLWHTKNVFMLSGFIPQKYAKKLEAALTSKFDIAIDFSALEDNDDVPVTLQNNAFASPVEGVLESYSLPGKGEVDPTSVMAIFYYILFGMMLSDAAYGLIIVAACGFVLAKYKNIKSGMKKALKMFLFCGISTTFWGVLFGSYFGDIIDVVSTTFFNNPITVPALWFVPLNEPMRMLAFSFGIGIIHLFTGLFMQLYELILARKFKDAIYDVVSWYLLVGGLVVYMLSVPMITEMLLLNFILPPIVGNIGIISAVIGALLILFTAGRESKSPFKRLLKGLYGLYGVTGYLSDILSYSRLLALGLATGVIAQVFNKMGTMAGNGPVGIILFVIVFLVGHTMNIAINLLGAYVHTNRLQFVEFFGKFYQGGGKKFSPFFVNTKYFNVTEDIYNE
mgnify:CR=1 FL=1